MGLPKPQGLRTEHRSILQQFSRAPMPALRLALLAAALAAGEPWTPGSAAQTPATSLQARLKGTGVWAARPAHCIPPPLPPASPPAVGAQENAACVPLPQPSGDALKAASDNGITNPALLDTLVKVGRPGGCLGW